MSAPVETNPAVEEQTVDAPAPAVEAEAIPVEEAPKEEVAVTVRTSFCFFFCSYLALGSTQ
jgi:hypothetical protein